MKKNTLAYFDTELNEKTTYHNLVKFIIAHQLQIYKTLQLFTSLF
jgi:hypothetical protein